MISQSLRLVLPSLAALLLFAAPASAGPFANDDLFVGPSMKISSKDRRFTAGANFQVAPVKAIQKKVVTDQVNSFKADNPEMAPIVDNLKYVDTKQLKALADSGKVEEAKKLIIDQAAKNGHPLTPTQQKGLDVINPTSLKLVANVIEIYNEPPQSALTFSLDPFAELNLAPVSIRAQVAIAGFHTDSGNQFALGNLGVLLKTGDSYGTNGAAFGWTLGVDLWAPTGTADADMIAPSNILAAPRYLHSYFTYAPFAMLGVDLPVVDFMLHGRYVDMRPMRDKEADLFHGELQKMAYADIGAAAVIDLGLVGITLEIDGLQEIDNAPQMDNVWLGTGGLRGFLGPVQVGAAVQVPLVKPDQAEHSMAGVGTGELASFNFLLNGQVKF